MIFRGNSAQWVMLLTRQIRLGHSRSYPSRGILAPLFRMLLLSTLNDPVFLPVIFQPSNRRLSEPSGETFS